MRLCGLWRGYAALTVKCENDEDPEAAGSVEQKSQRVGQYVYASGRNSFWRRGAAFMRKGKDAAVADRLPADDLAQRWNVPAYRLRCWKACVAYSTEAQMSTLGVREETLRAHGADRSRRRLKWPRASSACRADFGLPPRASRVRRRDGGKNRGPGIHRLRLAGRTDGNGTALRGDASDCTLAALNALHLLPSADHGGMTIFTEN